jgi:hypothetical protein
MSVGVYFSITASAGSAEIAAEAIRIVSLVLRARGAQYADPWTIPDPYRRFEGTRGIGRSGTDYSDAASLAGLSRFHGQLAGLGRPARAVWVPYPLDPPLVGKGPVVSWVGSVEGLAQDLLVIAPRLGIPLVDGTLVDSVAARIASGEDAPRAMAGQRTAWLLVHEAARHALRHGLPVVLAGGRDTGT